MCIQPDRCFPIVFVVSLNGIMCQLIRNIIRQESFLGDEKSVASLSFDIKHYMVLGTLLSFLEVASVKNNPAKYLSRLKIHNLLPKL